MSKHTEVLEEMAKYLQGVLRRAKEGNAHNPGLYLCLELQNTTLKQIQAIQWYVKAYEELKRGENNWWQKRWLNNDAGKELFEIRKKWLIAFQCAENYQKMYDEVVKKGETQ